MKNAAKNQDFEKAASARDQFLSLERIISHARLSQIEVSSSHNWNLIEKELQKLLATKKRVSRIEAYDISNIQGKEATGSQVTFLKGVPLKEYYRKYKIHITGKPNDVAMMKELVSRRLSHPEWPYPQLIVIDGGKGQLNAALAALRSAKFQMPNSKTNPKYKIRNTKYEIYVSALAKRRNELFLPGRKNSVLLQDLPRSVENMFLHIRDEAHRFAITYHRTLRSRALLD